MERKNCFGAMLLKGSEAQVLRQATKLLVSPPCLLPLLLLILPLIIGMIQLLTRRRDHLNTTNVGKALDVGGNIFRELLYFRVKQVVQVIDILCIPLRSEFPLKPILF